MKIIFWVVWVFRGNAIGYNSFNTLNHIFWIYAFFTDVLWVVLEIIKYNQIAVRSIAMIGELIL